MRIVKKKASDFDDFFLATVLADIFEPTGSKDLDLVSQKVTDGLSKHVILDNEDFEKGESIAA